MKKGVDMGTRKKIGQILAKEYQRARKKEKGKILDSIVKTIGYNRGYAKWLLRNWGREIVIWRGSRRIRVIGECRRKKQRTREKAAEYGKEVKEALREIWQILDYPSSKRLVPYLPIFLEKVEELGLFPLTPETREKLLHISSSTIDRLLKKEKWRWRLKRRGCTKPGTLLKSRIPVRTFADWKEQKPGFVEMDLVSHDGGNGSGIYSHTLDVTDVLTGWTETAGVENRSQERVFGGITQLRRQFPFPWLGIDSDSGGEFINDHLVRYCRQEKLTFTRGRAYNKNDSCYVEQKNWHIVRRTVGYWRYETEQEVRILNQIYRWLRLYTNYFQPQMKCVAKSRDKSRWIKKYDQAKTPYQRVLESPHVSEENKKRLRQEYRGLNPRELKREIDRLQLKLENIVRKKEIGRKTNIKRPLLG